MRARTFILVLLLVAACEQGSPVGASGAGSQGGSSAPPSGSGGEGRPDAAAGPEATRADAAAPSADGPTNASELDAGEQCRVEEVRLGVCVMRDVPQGEPVIELGGTVDEIRRDDWDCPGIGAAYDAAPRDARYRVHVVDGASGLWFGLTLPWSTPLVAVGDRVSVRFVQDSGGLGAPWPGAFELTDAEGSLLLWLADDESTERLTPPLETTVRDGERVCGGETLCYTFDELAMRVTAGGETETLQPGERADVGPYVAVHGGNRRVTGTLGCTDCCTGHASVALVRGDLATLDARDRPPCASRPCDAGEVCEPPADARCDPSHPDAKCTPVPETCEETCPGVCGCDGRFYCSECWAARAGVAVADDTACTAPTCEADASALGPDGCTVYWLCAEEQLAIQCERDGDGFACTCSRDHRIVHGFQSATLPDCEGEPAALACGLPWSRYAAN